MSDHNELRYFFSNEQVLNRVFMLYGNTTDCYRTASYSWLSFDRMLESHLRFLGYEVVLFYRGGNVLECFDRELKKNLKEHFPTERNAGDASASEPAGKDGTAPAESGGKTEAETAHKKKPTIIGGEIFSGKKASPSPKKDPDKKDDIKIKAEKIPGYLNRIMRDGTVKSCVVFTHCWQIFEHDDDPINKEIATYMNSWFALPTENNNICILLFNEPRLGSLCHFMENRGSWAFLYERMFQNRKPTEAVIQVGAPQKDEIRYQMESFFTNIPVTDDLEEAGLTLVQKNGGKLQFLRKYLCEKENEPQEQTAAQLLKEYGAESQEDALEKLRTTEGWKEVYELAKRLIEEKESYPKLEEEYPLENRTNLRMAYPRRTPGHKVNMSIMLTGNPGTGKTTVTSWLGLALHQHGLLPVGRVIKVAKQDLEAGYVGQSAIQTQDKINEAVGSVLFVDEAYALFRKENESGGSFGRDVIDTFVDQMTSKMGDMAFVFAGYPEPMDHFITANPGLMRRFGDNIVTIPDYSPDMLERIALKSIADNNNQGAAASAGELSAPSRIRYVMDADLIWHEDVPHDSVPIPVNEAIELIRGFRKEGKPLGPISHYFNNWYADRDRASFGNVGSALQLAESLKTNARQRTGKTYGEIRITAQDFPEQTEHLFVCRKPSLDEIKKQMADVIGMDSVKETLYRITSYLQLTAVQNKRKAAKHNIKPAKVEPGNYLFIGNPGTGKTMISEKLALTLSGLGIIERYQPVRVTGLELTNMVRGVNGVDKVKEFIDQRNGGVLVIDEAHQLADTNFGPIAVKALLDPMINYRTSMSFVFCCYPENVEDLLRIEPGLARRISDMMYFEDYTADEILQILLLKAKKEGYIIPEESSACFLQAIKEIVALNQAENGGTAEKLLKEAKAEIGHRIADHFGGIQELEAALETEEIDEEQLYVITPDDVRAAAERLQASRLARRGHVLNRKPAISQNIQNDNGQNDNE